MKNLSLILLTQQFPTRVKRALDTGIAGKPPGGVSQPPFYGDITSYCSASVPPRRALVTLRPDIWLSAVSQHPHISLYNHYGFVFSLVKALNECGFIVDLVDPLSSHRLSASYDLLVAHGPDCGQFLEQLPPDIPVYEYVSGLYWKKFEEESQERYDRFFTRHKTPLPAAHRRSITPLATGLELLNRRADVMFTSHCPRMAAGYGAHLSKFVFTGLGAYLDSRFVLDSGEREFETGRKNFIYVGGTGGNIQKGLDLVIEAFQQLPDLNLYIYCKVEEEIVKHCRNELRSPNVHYIYHWKYRPFRKRLRNLLKRICFSLHAPINSGVGTAFAATMGAGMIPVGYVDLPDPGESAVLTDSWQIDDLVACIRRASEKSPQWCREASLLTLRKYDEQIDPDQVERNFVAMFSKLAHA